MRDEITARVGFQFYSFDGRILEVFGGHPHRFHIQNLHLSVTDPDRKGRRTVEIVHARPGATGHSLSWQVTAAEWERSPDLVALLEAVQASIDGI
ncbi:hypothetical protein [Streptomyces sp. MBT53]|uniref:hypothetical protein n=1 Tax=Streptomyces sp. MBT53 TaxID=1488384 RepID=UPI001914B9A8|nr:hypothetical protein [Streptomyces sp. MBT53]MBK6010337.1 hypothetical protein [Streptomyces sp. MBT53]